MNGYLDIHSHILPGVDDGSKDIAMTMQMLGQVYDEGVRYIVATPHYYPGHKNAPISRIREKFETIRQEAAKQYPDMTIMLGNEIYYKDETVSLLKKNEILTLNDSRYVLVEFNVGLEYKKIYHAIKKFTMEGYYPILAHVERYACLYKQERLVDELVQAGAYIQVNAETFLGGIFDSYKKYCMKLMNSELIHFLGSDCHNIDNRCAVMEQAVRVLRKKIEPNILENVLVNNPIRFLNNEFI